RQERQDTLVWEDSPDNLVGLEGEDTDFEQQNWGLDLELSHDLTDSVTLGGRVSYARFDNDVVTLNSEIDAEDVVGTLPTEQSFFDDPTVKPFGLEPDSLETIASLDEEWQAEADAEFQ